MGAVTVDIGTLVYIYRLSLLYIRLSNQSDELRRSLAALKELMTMTVWPARFKEKQGPVDAEMVSREGTPRTKNEFTKFSSPSFKL